MAFIIKDRVKEGTTSTGTGAVSLGGAAATFDPFNSYMTNGDTTYYAIVHTASGTDEWEVGLGTWNTGNTLTRTTVLAGSNGTSAVNFSSGTKDIFMTYPASKALYADADGSVTLPDGLSVMGQIDGATSLEVETHIDLNTTTQNKPSHSEGRIFYDAAFGALAVYNDEADITLQVGQEEYIRVKNDTGATITNGTPVYLTGEDASTPTIAAAVADGTYAQSQAVGVATHDIEANSIGYITVRGLIADVDTSHLTVGEKVHVDVGGGTTTSAPSYPYFATDVGICLISSASGGCIYVYVETHAFESIRVTDNAHFDGNVTIDGDLTVLGDQTIAASSNISIGNAWNYFNAGDTIGSDNTTFTGTGLDDATLVGHFNGTSSKTFYVKIDATGTPDTFSWSDDNFVTTEATGVAITGAEQTLADGVKVEFNATTGHTVGDIWSGTAAPSNVDTGIASNRNTGTSGVGYTHIGLYYDVSTNKWTFFDEYDPEPEGTIDPTDSSFSYATVKAGTFEGNLTGNVTGAVTGNVSGNVTGSLTGNVTGNVTGDVTGDVTGNADTATALETARTIQLSGDVTGSATFDGTANINITAAVQDDSHAHVISNVDGLQAALDAKADDTTTITAGNGLTGGGSLGANRTLNVGAGGGITVSADAVAHADTSSQASVNNSGNTFIQDVTLDTYGHVTGLTSSTVTVGDATITVASGGGLTGSGDFTTNQGTNETITLSHADTSSQASVNNSGRTYIQDITLDTYGHITGITSATETVTNTNQLTTFQVEDGDGTEVTISHGKEWKFVEGGGVNIDWTDTTPGSDADPYDLTFTINTGVTAGSGLTGGGTLNANRTISHADTSNQASVNNSNGTVIQDVTLDGFGHVTGLASVNLDGRYYTETEADSRFVNVTGDTMSGRLTMFTSNVQAPSSSDATTGARFVLYPLGSGRDYAIGIESGTMWFNSDDHYKWYVDGSKKFEWDNTAGNLKVGANTVFHDGYHPNADKWTTARTLSLSGDASGSVSWDGSANATLSVTVANDSHNHSYITEKSTITYGASYLQWLDINGTGGSNGNGNAPSNPTNDWYHHIIANHANSGGYYVDIAQSFHSDAVYHRRLENGSLGSWRRFFTDVYHPNADKWTTARTLSLSGDASGSVSWDGSANATLSVTVANDSHTHDGRYYTESEADSRFPNVQATFRSGAQNFDSFKTSGFHSLYNANASGHTNAPFQYGTMLSVGNTAQGGGMAMQLAHERLNNGTYIRGMNDTNDTWYSWQRIFMDNYHPNADKWTTARTLSLSGDASGSVSWDGSANATLTVDVGNAQTVDGYNAPQIYNGSHSYLAGYYQNGSTGQKPNHSHLGAGKMKLTMQSSSNLGFGGSWNDVLWMSSYTGGDVKKSTALVSSKYDNTSLYIAKQNYDSASWGTGYLIWNSGNDGSGSGLDADLLDGLQASNFLRSDVEDSGVGINLNGGTLNQGNDATLYVTAGGNQDWGIKINATSGKTDYGQVIEMPASYTYAFRVLGNGSEHFRISSGLAQHSSSLRAPIFYDTNNTSYYCDPGSATNGITFYSAAGAIKMRGQTHWENKPGIDLQGGTSEFRFSSTGGNLNIRTDGWVIAHDQMQATIFYDINNTGYYVDPASTSNLNNLTVNGTLNANVAKNGIFWENNQTVTSNYTITNGKNAMSAGPITVNSGVTVTIGDGEAWTVV